jgi:amino acid transporter
MRASQVVAADTLRAAFGTAGAALITAMIILAALSTANATIFTGARTNYALGRDFSIFRFLGHWQERAGTPKNGLLVQGLIALALVGLGGTQKGVETMVDYTAPVFWFFFLLVGVALFVLRYKDPDAERAFRVPLYPFLPLVFCATCGYMLYASLAYTKAGALVGVGVLLAGVPVMLLARAKRDTPPSDEKVAPAAKTDITSND